MDKHERAEFNKILRILEKHWGEKLTPDLIAEITQMYSTYRGRYELLKLIAPYEKEELPKPPTPFWEGQNSGSIFRTIILLFSCLAIFVLSAQYLPFDEQTPPIVVVLLTILSLVSVVSLFHIETKTQTPGVMYQLIVLFLIISPCCLIVQLIKAPPMNLDIFSPGESNILEIITGVGIITATLAASETLSGFGEEISSFFWKVFHYQIKSRRWLTAILFLLLSGIFFLIMLLFA